MVSWSSCLSLNCMPFSSVQAFKTALSSSFWIKPSSSFTKHSQILSTNSHNCFLINIVIFWYRFDHIFETKIGLCPHPIDRISSPSLREIQPMKLYWSHPCQRCGRLAQRKTAKDGKDNKKKQMQIYTTLFEMNKLTLKEKSSYYV